jgi:hypothetical protein
MKLYLILLIFLILVITYNCYKTIENFGSYTSDGNIPELLEKAMNTLDITKSNNEQEEYDYYIPKEYNTCEKSVVKFENTNKKVFLIDGCDWPASKVHLWKLLKEYYGKDANKYMPTTFLLEDKEDLKEFPKHFEEKNKEKKGHMFVLKNYAQRQEGIKLTRDLDEILNGVKDGWYLVQDYLYKPYKIDNRKVNFRYYTLIVCRNGSVEGYIHKNGFVYYTPKYYDEDDIDFNKHITTGYIDRKVYEENPLTLEDFRHHLEKQQIGLSKLWDSNVNRLMNKIIEAVSRKVCKNDKLKNNVLFQLYGSDIAITDTFEPYIMEMNKGPDLGAKDERDKAVKFTMQKDIFKTIEVYDKNNMFYTDNNFIRVF